MLSSWPSRIALGVGIGALALVVLNQWLAPEVTPSLERADVLASVLAVGLMLVAVLWTRAVPEARVRVPLEGEQGLELAPDLPDNLCEELGWGSRMFLTATPAATMLVIWDGSTLLRRGLLGSATFSPAALCRLAHSRQAAVSLPGLPSVVVQPLGSRGWVLLGGWSVRCFSRADLQWLEGWAARLTAGLERFSSPPIQPTNPDSPGDAGSEGGDGCWQRSAESDSPGWRSLQPGWITTSVSSWRNTNPSPLSWSLPSCPLNGIGEEASWRGRFTEVSPASSQAFAPRSSNLTGPARTSCC